MVLATMSLGQSPPGPTTSPTRQLALLPTGTPTLAELNRLLDEGKPAEVLQQVARITGSQLYSKKQQPSGKQPAMRSMPGTAHVRTNPASTHVAHPRSGNVWRAESCFPRPPALWKFGRATPAIRR